MINTDITYHPDGSVTLSSECFDRARESMPNAIEGTPTLVFNRDSTVNIPLADLVYLERQAKKRADIEEAVIVASRILLDPEEMPEEMRLEMINDFRHLVHKFSIELMLYVAETTT